MGVNYAPLEKALSTVNILAKVEETSPTRIDIHWECGTMEPGVGLIDFIHPKSVAEATLVKMPDGGAEWARFLVQPSARGYGILTRCFGLSEKLQKKLDIWPVYISEAANNSDFYREAGWESDPNHPGLMVKNQEKAEDWVSRQLRKST